MPAFAADGYSIYRQWCIDHHQAPPTREWWDHACSQPRTHIARRLTDDEFDDEVERREGWSYDPS